MQSNVQTSQLEPFGLQTADVSPCTQQCSVATSHVTPGAHGIFFAVVVPLSGTVPLVEDDDEDVDDDDDVVPPVLEVDDPLEFPEVDEDELLVLPLVVPLLPPSGAAPLPSRLSNDGKRQPPRMAAVINTAQTPRITAERS